MDLEANKQLARDYFTAFVAGDEAWMTRHIAPSFVRHDPGLPFEVRGPEGVMKLNALLMPAFPDLEIDCADFVAEGDKVLVRLTVRGTLKGEFAGVQPRGQRMEAGVMDLFQMRDGVLVEHWALMDNLTMLKQVGALG